MADHLRRVFRFYLLLAVLPLLTGFVGVWSTTIGHLLALLIPIALLVVLFGTPFWIDRAMKLPVPPVERRQRALAIGLAPLLLVASVVTIVPLFDAGNVAASLIRLTTSHDQYEAIIAQARANPRERYGQRAGIDYAVVPGPPVRVAFRYGEMRLLWGATVYDPSGDVMQAKGMDQSGRQIAPASISHLGMILGCRHLWGDYYTCWEDW